MTARALSSNFFVILLALLVVCCHCSTHILFLDWFVNRFGHFAGHVGCFRFWLIATAGKTWLTVHLPAWQWRSYIPCKSSHDYCSFSWALLHAVVVVVMMMMMMTTPGPNSLQFWRVRPSSPGDRGRFLHRTPKRSTPHKRIKMQQLR